MTTRPVEISVVIPAYNEGLRIQSSLTQIARHFSGQGINFEVIVVDDGSTDDTVAVVQETAREYPAVRLLHNDRNRGKGFSVRHGVLESEGAFILFSDADLSAPIEEAAKLLAPLRQGRSDVTIGSRALKRELIGIRQPWMREQSGKIFNLLVRLILGLPYGDTQCGFKAFRADAVRKIFRQQLVLGFGFDPEMLYLARSRRLRIEEVPVRWDHVPGSKVRFLSDSMRMFLDLLRIRWNDIRGKYRRED